MNRYKIFDIPIDNVSMVSVETENILAKGEQRKIFTINRDFAFRKERPKL